MGDIGLSYTQRDFLRGDFKDRNGEVCSIQKSSIATEDCLWLGVNNVTPMMLVQGQGWQEIELPKGALTAGRMHLTREHVKGLLPLLQHFAETGELPYEEEGSE